MKINQQNLWDKFISAENFELALHNAVRGKKDKAAIVNFMRDAANNLESIRRSVINGDFRTSEYRTMEITDPKPRTIYILPFAPDRIVHHALMNVLAPRWTRMFIRDTYACIPGRGLHSASRRAMEFCRRNEYVLKCDVRKFYPSVRHDVLLEIVMKSIGLIAPSHAHPPKSVISAGPGVGGSARRAVGEAFAENSHSLPPGARESAAAPLQGRGELVDVLRDIIYSAGGGKNLPIGNLCSQWMGNLYLNELDRFVKNDLGVRDYVRYSDDFCLFSNDKAQLREWRAQIREFLDSHLGLEFSKSEIFPVANGLDFVGYRHFGDFVLLRKRTAKRIRARLQRIGGMREIPAAAAGKIRGQVASAYGWMKFACSYNMRKSVQFVKLKNMVGIEQHSH